MSTIQQQLETFAANPVVDGVRWEVLKKNSNDAELVFNSGRLSLFVWLPQNESGPPNIKRAVPFYRCYVKGFSHDSFVINLTATTPADACREALRICRERVAELAEALGMAPNTDQLDKWAVEHIAQNGHKWSNNTDQAGDNYGSFVEGAKAALAGGMAMAGEDYFVCELENGKLNQISILFKSLPDANSFMLTMKEGAYYKTIRPNVKLVIVNTILNQPPGQATTSVKWWRNTLTRPLA